MSNWYEVFDNEEVQLVTRNRMIKLIRVLVVAFAVSVTFILTTSAQPVTRVLTVLVLGCVWFNVSFWIIRKLNQIRRVMWCLKLSDRRIVGYDYARRKTVLDWIHVGRVEVTDQSIMVVGTENTYLEIPHLFPDFSTISHRIVEYAEFYHVPVYINGVPWDQVDVHRLYPSLTDDTPLSDDGAPLA